MMLGRPIANKQIGYGFYRPAALVFANFFSDIPFSAVRVLIFNVIVYFMPDLWVISVSLTSLLSHFALRARSAGGFFTFHLFIYMAYLVMQGFFRTFGLLCISFDGAFRLATFFLPNMIQYTGYMIPTFQMKRWLFWIVGSTLSFMNASDWRADIPQSPVLCVGWTRGERIHAHVIGLRRSIRHSQKLARNNQIVISFLQNNRDQHTT